MNPFITSIIAFVISPTIVLILSSTANLYQFNPLLLSCALTPKHIHQNIYTKTYTPKHIHQNIYSYYGCGVCISFMKTFNE